jgi:hypothetical protein
VSQATSKVHAYCKRLDESLHDTFLTAVPLVAIALVIALFLKEKSLATRDSVETPAADDQEAAGTR